MSQTLNDAQRKLVEDNHNLIYSFLNSHNLSLDAVEDWYGTAAIGLCKAAMIYDEKKGYKFATLAYIVMDNEVKIVMRQNRKYISNTLSLDAPVEGSGDLTYADIIPDSEDFMYSIYLNEALDIALRGLSERDKTVITMIADYGMRHEDVAERLGMSRSNVSMIYAKFIGKLRAYFND